MRVKLVASIVVPFVGRGQHAVHLVGHLRLLAPCHGAGADLLGTIVMLAADLALNLPLAGLSRGTWLEQRPRAPILLRLFLVFDQLVEFVGRHAA